VRHNGVGHRAGKEGWGLEFQTSGNTIDVRGNRADEALARVDQELSEKARNGVVYIVHGVGTGALRNAVHNYLKKEQTVSRFELEEDSNGGCTVVYM
jgi:DNA mismatch repair protein MutS2